VRDKTWSLLVGRAFAAFGKGSVISLPVKLAGIETISIGAGVYIGPASWLQSVPAYEGRAAISIGDGTSIAGGLVISAAQRVTLGCNVLLAKNVYISDHIHAYDQPDVPIMAQGVTRVASVRIGDGAWLGQGVVVVPGVSIGRGSVIGANSVVTTDVPDRCLAVGAPAVVVRSLDEPLAV
jgi:acetyltransferase-like isoleucine patch superfamily enzyme